MTDSVDIDIISHIISDKNEVVVFDSFEEITGLNVRRCWIVEFDDESIKRLVEIKQNIIKG